MVGSRIHSDTKHCLCDQAGDILGTALSIAMNGLLVTRWRKVCVDLQSIARGYGEPAICRRAFQNGATGAIRMPASRKLLRSGGIPRLRDSSVGLALSSADKDG